MLEKDPQMRFDINRVDKELKEIMNENKIFLSYCHKNMEIVEKIAAKLNQSTQHSIRVDMYGLRSGNNIIDISDAIKNSNLFIAFIDQDYCKSSACDMEFQYAKGQKKAILAVILESELNYNGYVEEFSQYEAFKENNFEDLFQNLFNHITKLTETENNKM